MIFEKFEKIEVFDVNSGNWYSGTYQFGPHGNDKDHYVICPTLWHTIIKIPPDKFRKFQQKEYFIDILIGVIC